MAAAVLTKNVLLRTRRCHQALRIFRQRTCSKHSTPDTPIAAQKNIIGARLANQFIRYKWPSSIFSSSGSSSSSSSEFGFVGWYMGMIKTRPVSTKSITCALIYTAADLSSQSIVGESSDGYDLVRTLRMAGYGMLIIGPSLHYWFNFVSRVYPKRDILSTFKKMALGQTVYGPVVTTIFFSANAAAQA